MHPWFHHPQSNYVFAAYGLMAVGLVGLLLVSWAINRRRKAEWRRLSKKKL